MFGRKTSNEVLSLSKEEAGSAITMTYLYVDRKDIQHDDHRRLFDKLNAFFKDLEVGDEYEIFIRRR